MLMVCVLEIFWALLVAISSSTLTCPALISFLTSVRERSVALLIYLSSRKLLSIQNICRLHRKVSKNAVGTGTLKGEQGFHDCLIAI